MHDRSDAVWKASTLAQLYLDGVRGAIPLATEQVDVMMTLIGATGRSVECFLDLGCGDGILSAAVLERFPEAHGTLVDFSVPMLERAAKRFESGTRPVSFVNADYAQPRWTHAVKDFAPFDVVISGFSIDYQPDVRKREIYEEILDLLRPGGIFTNVEHVASATSWVAALHDELFIDHLQAHHTDRSREQVADAYYRRPNKAANILAPVEAQCVWLRNLGFTDVDCYLKIFELAVFGGRKP
jgi:tRNA (cmo5U34)-methyltransferase